MTIPRTDVESEVRAPVIRRTIIVDRGSIIRIPVDRWSVRRVHLCLLVHVKMDFLRNTIFRAEPLAGPEKADLLKLVRCQRQGPDHIVRSAEVVKRPVRIAENLQMQRGVPSL